VDRTEAELIMIKETGILYTKLNEVQQAELADKLLSGMSYWKALQFIAKEWRVKLKSPSVIGKFYEKVCLPLHLARRKSAANAATLIGDAAESAGIFDQATLSNLKQKLFELSLAPKPNTGALLKLAMILQRADDNQTRRDELALKVDRWQFDTSKAALKEAAALKAIQADSSLTDREKIDAARKRLFGRVAT
jgi:hypothetical protein